MNKLKEEFDKLSGDQYNVSWNDKVEIIYLKDYIDFLEKKIEALSQHDVILPLPNKCTCWGGNIDCFSGNCTVCGNRKGNGI